MSKTNLLEISLVVEGEIAEAVSEVLARFIPNGVVVESTQIVPDPDGEGHVAGPLKVYGFLPADAQNEDLRQKIEEALWYLGRISPVPSPTFRIIQEKNWVDAWKEHYKPIPIGQRLMIVPSWIDPDNHGRIPVRIDPGMAFGTGTHPTTHLCLTMAERHIVPGGGVIDIGCGSGILSIAALKLGAGRALGVDIDPLAIQASYHNAALNGVEDLAQFAAGSVAEVREGAYSLRKAPLVFANILAPIIIGLFPEGLGELVSPNGVCILSGILDEQAEGVAKAAFDQGYKVIETQQSGDWVALGVKANLPT